MNYREFNPLMTADEMRLGFANEQQAYNDWKSQYGGMWTDPNAARQNVPGTTAVRGTRGQASNMPGEAFLPRGVDYSTQDTMSVPMGGGSFIGSEFGGGRAAGGGMMTLPSLDAMRRAGITDFDTPSASTPFSGVNVPPPPPMPDEGLLNANINRLATNKGIQQSAYNRMTGGGYTGGVLPNNMAETFASGGQFKGAPQSGVRPNNPFGQSQGPSYGAPGTGAAGVYGQAGSQGAGTYGAPMGGIENSNPIGGFGGPFSRINPYA